LRASRIPPDGAEERTYEGTRHGVEELAGFCARTERGTEEPAWGRAGSDEGVLGSRPKRARPRQGALDGKTKELIAIAISVAIRCDDCIAFHVKAAVDHGATREEILETLGMTIYMGAGPSAMYASHALGAYADFAAAKANAA